MAVSKKASKRSKSRWSARVTQRSNALDLEPKVFRSTNPRKIAVSLKRSAERSKRRKAKPYQSAMSMLNFYINRAGKNLPQKQKRVLERAKDELRDVWPNVNSHGALQSSHSTNRSANIIGSLAPSKSPLSHRRPGVSS